MNTSQKTRGQKCNSEKLELILNVLKQIDTSIVDDKG